MLLSPFAFTYDALRSDDTLSFFALALKNARFSMGNTYPNPSVGAVLVRDGCLLGEGFTEPAGGMHAEKMALARVKNAQGATLYVTLEPCSHFGRTPPCTDALIKAGIKKVVYGVIDPNPMVAGAGLRALNEAGIRVERIEDATMQAFAQAHIRPFATYILEKRPYVVLKVAVTNDNAVAKNDGPLKITGPQANVAVHQLRRAVDAILIGAGTERIDDPELTARLGLERHGTQPRRLVLSADLTLDLNARIFDVKNAPTWVLTSIFAPDKKRQKLLERGVRLIDCPLRADGLIDLRASLRTLADQGLTSILIEAGPRLQKSVISEGLADEIWWFKAPHNVGAQGLKAYMTPKEFASYGYEHGSTQGLGIDRLSIWHKKSTITPHEPVRI